MVRVAQLSRAASRASLSFSPAILNSSLLGVLLTFAPERTIKVDMRSYIIMALALLGALLALNSVVTRGETRPSEKPAYKVMVLGFDGVDPEFLEYLIEEGRLPNFARLLREGAYAPCQTFKPTKSVVHDIRSRKPEHLMCPSYS